MEPELFISRATSPWQGYTSSYAEEQAGRHVAAARLQPGWEALPHLAAYAAEGSPLLAVDRAARRVHVDERFFGDLDRVDVPRLGPGQRAVAGRLKRLPAGFTHGRLARFLLEAQLVVTYWHLEARLRVEEERDDPTAFSATFAGTHTYATNEVNEDPLRFTLTIDRASGEISLAAA